MLKAKLLLLIDWANNVLKVNKLARYNIQVSEHFVSLQRNLVDINFNLVLLVFSTNFKCCLNYGWAVLDILKFEYCFVLENTHQFNTGHLTNGNIFCLALFPRRFLGGFSHRDRLLARTVLVLVYILR